MKIKKCLLFCLLLIAVSFSLTAQTFPEISTILEKMRLANQYFFNKFPNPGSMADPTRPGNIWTRSTYMEGLLALYYVDSDPACYDYANAWGEYHNWGMRSGPTTRNADDQCCGQSYIEMYLIEPEPEKIRDITTSIDRMVNSYSNSDWDWIDAIHMAMPVFAKLGVIYNDYSYFDKMYSLYSYTRNNHGSNGLYNQGEGLWWRDSSFDPPYTEPNGEDCYWSRGNGWVFAALVRVLDVLPEDDIHREEYIQTFQEMAPALLAVQRSDGFWNVSLHDPDHYGGPETSGTAFFTYGMAWGIRKGFLDADTYLPIAIKGWNALSNNALHDNGFLGYVQGTGKQPSDGQPVSYDSVPNYEDYALGAFLLAGSEMAKLSIEFSGTPLPTPSMTPEPTNEPTPVVTQNPDSNMGDVNRDGNIDIVDGLLVAQYMVLIPVDIDLSVGDVNCSKTVDIVDALLIVQFYVGLVSGFTECTPTEAPSSPPTEAPTETPTPALTPTPTATPIASPTPRPTRIPWGF